MAFPFSVYTFSVENNRYFHIVPQTDSSSADSSAECLRIDLDSIFGLRCGELLWGGYGLASKCSHVTIREGAYESLIFKINPEFGDRVFGVNLVDWLEVKHGKLICNHPMVLAREALYESSFPRNDKTDESTEGTNFTKRFVEGRSRGRLENAEDVAIFIESRLPLILQEIDMNERGMKETLQPIENRESVFQDFALRIKLFEYIMHRQHYFSNQGQRYEEALMARSFASTLWVTLKAYTSSPSVRCVGERALDRFVSTLRKKCPKPYRHFATEMQEAQFRIWKFRFVRIDSLTASLRMSRDEIDKTFENMPAWARNGPEDWDEILHYVDLNPRPRSTCEEQPDRSFEKCHIPRDLSSYEVARQIRDFLLASPGMVSSFCSENGEMMLRFCRNSNEETVSVAAMREEFIARNAGRDPTLSRHQNFPEVVPPGAGSNDLDDMVWVERPGVDLETG